MAALRPAKDEQGTTVVVEDDESYQRKQRSAKGVSEKKDSETELRWQSLGE